MLEWGSHSYWKSGNNRNGLPPTVTLTLAYAMKKMIVDKALVRRLSTSETMGCATTDCSDKIGTLTLNQMTIVKAWVGGEMREPISELQMLHKDYIQVLFEGIVQNNNVSVYAPPKDGEPEVSGSPTEKAVLSWGLKLGVAVRPVKNRKVHVHWRGAAEIILVESDKMLYPDKGALPISTEERNHLLNVFEAMASASLRCIAFAFMKMDFELVPNGELAEE
ncbi:hypothetical protein L7F22_064049 [Adiantum nelumboides]|nr:hypothetical protein [Adiantum nelumboides]